MAYVFLSFTVCLVLYFDTAVTQCLRKPRILTDEEGTIQPLDRNDAELFDVGKDCKWIVEAPLGKRIVLTFDQEFDIPTEDNVACDVTYVRVFDGNNTDAKNSRGRYCGQIAPQRIISSSNILRVEFRSALTTTAGRGFTARYEHIDASSLEFRVFRDKKTWNEANVACRNKSGFLVSLTDRNHVEIQQQMRHDESIWSGAFSVWMWTRKCYKYEIENSDRKFNFTRNSASRCQRRCETDQVWLQGRTCLCNINMRNAELTEYKTCNQTCNTEPSDVCGGPGSVMHYETWKNYPNLLEDKDGNGNCVYITPKAAGDEWHIDSCYKSYLPLCKREDKTRANFDNYFIPPGQDQQFATYGIHSQAVEKCITNKSMIADISGKQKLESVITYLGDTPGLPSHTPQLWIGLKRKREIVTQYKSIVPEENKNFSCYFIQKNSTGAIEEELKGSCKEKMAYVCKLPVEKRTTAITPSSTSQLTTSGPTSTVASESDITLQTSPVKEQTTSSQNSTTSTGIAEEQKAQTSKQVLMIALSAAGGLLIVVIIIIAIVCIKKRHCKSEESQDKSKFETRRLYDYATTENIVDLHNIQPERKTNKYLQTNDMTQTPHGNENEEIDHYDVASGIVDVDKSKHPVNAVSQTGESSEKGSKGFNLLAQKNNTHSQKQHDVKVYYNELTVGNKPKPDANEYSLNQPDDGTYNVLSTNQHSSNDVNEYSLNQPDDGTYNFLSTNKRKSNDADDVSDMYDHTHAEELYDGLNNTGGKSKQKWDDAEGVYDHANDFESEYNELNLENSAKKVVVLDDTYDHTNIVD